MSGPDATASAELSAAILQPHWVGWLDFSGDPVRVTTAPYSVTFSGTGDSDLDGYTFDAVEPALVSISDIHHQDKGSDTVTASLSGLVGPNSDLLSIIGDRSLWRGREAALWLMLYDTSFARVGNVWRYYTGRMVSAPISGSPESQTIDVQIESYLASLSAASNRTYLDQADFDSGDLSAEAAIAIANGTHGANLRDVPAVGQYGGYGYYGWRF